MIFLNVLDLVLMLVKISMIYFMVSYVEGITLDLSGYCGVLADILNQLLKYSPVKNHSKYELYHL